MNAQDRMITGTFRDRDAANDAVDRLIAAGYDRDEISFVMSNDTRSRYFADTDATPGAPGAQDRSASVAKGAAGGAAVGGTIGAILAAFTLTGSVAATIATGGLAAPFVAGPAAAALAGAGGGGAIGSVIGALVGAGVPEDRAHALGSHIESGSIVVGVVPHAGDASTVQQILNDRDVPTTSGTAYASDVDAPAFDDASVVNPRGTTY